MATKITDVPNLEKQISGKQKEAETYKKGLQSSPTALGGMTDPTSSDLSNQESLQRINSEIQALNDTKLKTQWYGTDAPAKNSTSQEEGSPLGMIGAGLDFLTRPLYGVVGAVKSVTGKGTGNLYQDIADNMVRNKNTFGDVLKSSNVPWAISAPLGLALDIAMDPINWATMGTGAIVPRLGAGIVKGISTGEGVIKGLSTAAKSGALETATSIGRITPFLKKTEAFKTLGNASIKATEDWERLAGKSAADIVMNRGLGAGQYRMGLGDVINKVADAIPGGQSVLKNFIYDPTDWVRQARIKDIVQESLGSGADLRGAVNARVKGESIEPFLREQTSAMATKIENEPVVKTVFNIDPDGPAKLITNKEVDEKIVELNKLGIDSKISEVAPSVVKEVDDAVSILKNPDVYKTGDPIENGLRMANERVGGIGVTLDDLAKMVNSGVLDETGVKWFDGMMKKVKNFDLRVGRNGNKIVKIGENALNTYNTSMDIFRVSKVGASVTGFVNAVVGNVAMTHMANGDIGSGFLNKLGLAFNLYHNKPGTAKKVEDLLIKAIGPDEAARFFAEYKTATRGTFGSMSFVGNNKNAERILQAARDSGKISAGTKLEDVGADLKKAMNEVTQEHASLFSTREAILSGGEKAVKSSLATGMLSQEMFNSKASAKLFDYVAKKAASDSSNIGWKILNAGMNTMPSEYEKIDQVFKMATFLRATTDGYTINQLRQMKNIIKINPEELVKYASEGQNLYKLSPKTALELANVMYLNYAAMPSAVRVLRNFPILSSPFVSFMYGMTLKTGQTLAYNPSAFNKVSFALNEFSGTKTPLEKKALDTSYYSYLKEPGMFRLPLSSVFFDKNPMYINLASMIPYYSLNMFNAPQTKYGDSLPEKFVQAFQSAPFMKDPAGSAIFDYIIQPLILGEAIRPQGQFGQPLYPLDATGIEKAGYGVRSLAEAFVPNIASYAGLLTPEAAAQYIPSYRWRQLAMAKEGKNQLGISSKEPWQSRTFRTLAQASGIPIQAPVNTSFVEKK